MFAAIINDLIQQRGSRLSWHLGHIISGGVILVFNARVTRQIQELIQLRKETNKLVSNLFSDGKGEIAERLTSNLPISVIKTR